MADFKARLLAILEDVTSSELNPKLWDDDHIRQEVRTTLVTVANDFAAEHRIAADDISDIVLTGSMANYNWSEHSDIDVHLIVEPTKISSDSDLAKDYFKLAKSLWNKEHTITICGHEVEVYVQDKDEPHYSTGVYSLLHSKWLQKPSRERRECPSQAAVHRKAQPLAKKIAKLTDKNSTEATELKNKIKKMRSAGLAKGGEYSLENLAFKFLRDSGALDKLSQTELDAYDSEMSIRSCSSG